MATKDYSLKPGVAATGGPLLGHGGAALGNGIKAFACESAQFWWQTGMRHVPNKNNLNTCYVTQLETIDWSKYNDFESAWGQILAKCAQKSSTNKCTNGNLT